MPGPVELLKLIRCWKATSKALQHVHPSVFHGLYGTSHFAYMVLVWLEGHTLYAWVSLPAAIGYAGAWLCARAQQERENEGVD